MVLWSYEQSLLLWGKESNVSLPPLYPFKVASYYIYIIHLSSVTMSLLILPSLNNYNPGYCLSNDGAIKKFIVVAKAKHFTVILLFLTHTQNIKREKEEERKVVVVVVVV